MVFPSALPMKPWYVLFPHACHMSCPFHPNNIWYAVHIIKLLICSSLHSAATSSLSGPNISLCTLSFNTFSLCSSHDVNDQVSHPYKIGKISVLCTLICTLDSKWEDNESLRWMVAAAIPTVPSAFNSFTHTIFIVNYEGCKVLAVQSNVYTAALISHLSF